ncbi:MAG: serine/threonine-protein kinase [Acidobacteriota bacterium]
MKICPLCNKKFAGSTYCPYDGQELIGFVPNEDIVGRLVDNKYQLEERIARGGTGTVYRAVHLQLNVPVAVKVLHSDRISDTTAVERFRREAFAAMQVRHPNAIAVLDFGVTTDNVVYVVMELLSGLTLRQVLKKQCFVSMLEVNNIMQQICAAVAVAHKRKIVHRDLKPENVFLHYDNNEEVVRVLDFGLAKLRGLLGEGESMELTRDGLVIGTPLYMSPEQSRGRSVDKRSDIYSLGVMLYEMLTGQLPFHAPSLSALAVKHASEQPRPIYELRPELPAVVNAVVMHALEKSPKNRPATVMEWAAELQAAIKAVTEREFRHVFLTASDQDLEAAVLLTGEPGQLAASPNNNVNASTLPTPSTQSLVSNLDTIVGSLTEANSQSIDTARDSVRDSTNDTSLSPLTADSPEEREQIYQRLLSQAQETSMLLQIMIGDLSVKTPLDRVFFNELEIALEVLRKAMAETRKTFHN